MFEYRKFRSGWLFGVRRKKGGSFWDIEKKWNILKYTEPIWVCCRYKCRYSIVPWAKQRRSPKRGTVRRGFCFKNFPLEISKNETLHPTDKHLTDPNSIFSNIFPTLAPKKPGTMEKKQQRPQAGGFGVPFRQAEAASYARAQSRSELRRGLCGVAGRAAWRDVGVGHGGSRWRRP